MLLISIINYLRTFFNKTENTSALETYIVSKNPQSTYDVEYWTKEYDKSVSNRAYLEKLL